MRARRCTGDMATYSGTADLMLSRGPLVLPVAQWRAARLAAAYARPKAARWVRVAGFTARQGRISEVELDESLVLLSELLSESLPERGAAGSHTGTLVVVDDLGAAARARPSL